MTALADILIRRIVTQGPMTLAEFMTEALLHPEHGYYMARDPLGAAGDFTTAPEISQMFGELVGLFLARVWMDQGAPDPFILAELGPGRGTLLTDVLRATRTVPGFCDAACLHLVEVSPVLRSEQAARLTSHAPTWHMDMSDLPEGPLFLIANEFFDALPIRQFRRRGRAWEERVVGLSERRPVFGWTSAVPLGELTDRLADTTDGDIVETCAPAAVLAGRIGARIETDGGVALIVDYGSWRSRGDTFQAVRGHVSVDPLAAPGQADLTAHVDFAALSAAAGSAVAPMTTQGVFLERLGIVSRARHLAQNLTGQALADHIAAHRRLTHPDEMGDLFKMIAFHPTTSSLPPGFSR
ncbi:MAG: SAM-dependent methyltransferase [Pseudomonadota bacterium]